MSNIPFVSKLIIKNVVQNPAECVVMINPFVRMRLVTEVWDVSGLKVKASKSRNAPKISSKNDVQRVVRHAHFESKLSNKSTSAAEFCLFLTRKFKELNYI